MHALSRKLNITEHNPQAKNGWYSVGAGGGGALFTPRISPHDKNTWIVCCDMSNTYITYDAGKHWQMLHLCGMVNDIVFDPVNPGVIYAGAQAVYKSVDNGLTWKLVLPHADIVTPDSVIGRVKKIHIDRKHPDHIYVGFHTRRYQRSNPGGGLKLYHSPDGAVTWQDLGDMEGGEILCIDMAESGTSRVPTVFTNTGMYKYEAGTLTNQPLTFVPKVARCGIDPKTGTSVFYVASGVRVDEDGTVHSGVFRSNDGGLTWHELGGFDVDFPDKKNSARIVKDISFSYYNPDKLYLSISRWPLVLPSAKVDGEAYDPQWRHPFLNPDYTSDAKENALACYNRMGILVSNDGGATWQWSVEMDLNMPENITVGWYENAYDVDWLGPPWFMDVDEHNPNRVLASLQGFAWITENGGQTWEQVYTEQYEDGSWYGKGFESTTCYDVVFDPFDKGTMLITYTDNGMLKSTNGGKSWNHAIKGVPYNWINTCYKMIFDPEVPGLAWGVWTSVHDLPDHMWIRPHIAKIPPYACGGICVTHDSASTWQAITDMRSTGTIPTCIVLDPTSPVGSRTLYMSRYPDGVLKSTDGGKTWESKSNGMGVNKNVFSLYRSDDCTLYAVTTKSLTDEETPEDIRQAMWMGSVYVSDDGAETWRKLTLPQNVDSPQRIDFNPINPKHMYITAYPIIPGEPIQGGYRTLPKEESRGGGVYESTDGGATWQNIFDERVAVYGIQVDPKNPLAIYIVTPEYAAYRSLDGGKSWERIRGYHFSTGKNPILDPYNDDMMYITTFGGSVFYGPRAGGTERYDDIDGLTLDHKI